jgi:hypothetical protein
LPLAPATVLLKSSVLHVPSCVASICTAQYFALGAPVSQVHLTAHCSEMGHR